MTTRQTRFLLRTLSIAMLLASLIAVAWAVWPAARESGAAAAQASSPRKAAAAIVSSPALAELAVVWDKRLQGPLYDQPAPAGPLAEGDDETRQMPPPEGDTAGGVTLVGTMREEGKSLAIFLHAGGQIDLKQAGESIELPAGSMRVERIESGQVTLSSDGGSLTLRLPETGVQ